MIAIILAAGMGTRLMPLTKDVPKPLLEIDDTSLLERMMMNCISNGVNEFIIVLGYKKERVIEKIDYLKGKYPVKISTVENKKYSQTNTSCSVSLATQHLDDDVSCVERGPEHPCDSVAEEEAVFADSLESCQSLVLYLTELHSPGPWPRMRGFLRDRRSG